MPTRQKHHRVTVGEVVGKMRVDVYLSQAIEILSRSTLSDENTVILINGKTVKKSKPVQTGDVIDVSYTEEFFEGLVAQDIPLDILYEDSDMLVINKEQGMVVHPAHGNYEGTLVNALLFRYGDAFAKEDEGTMPESDTETDVLDSAAIRPGIVHRLDKDTSGVLVVARHKLSHRDLANQFKEHTTTKIYIAVVRGNFKAKSGVVEANLKRDPSDRKLFTTCASPEGRYAKTSYTVLKQYKDCSLLRIALFTGRTHQIRVHMLSIGHPIVGDPLYGKEEPGGLLLHASLLEVDHPTTRARMRFRSPLPPRFRHYLKSR